MALLQPEPSQLTFRLAFLASSLPGRSPSQRFVGGPGGGGGTPSAWLNIPVCSFPGDETFVSLRGGLTDTGGAPGRVEEEEEDDEEEEEEVRGDLSESRLTDSDRFASTLPFFFFHL